MATCVFLLPLVVLCVCAMQKHELDQRLAGVRIGMTFAEVKTIMGDDVWDDSDHETERYLWAEDRGTAVVVLRAGRVVDKAFAHTGGNPLDRLLALLNL